MIDIHDRKRKLLNHLKREKDPDVISFINALNVSNYSVARMERYLEVLPLIERIIGKPLREANRKDIEKVVAEMGKREPWTRVTYLHMVKVFYRWLVNGTLEKGIITNVQLEEDRNPVYTLKGTGPPMTPAQWTVLTTLFLRGPQIAYESLKNELFKKYAWDESITLSAVNFLLDMGYVKSSRSVSSVYYALTQRSIDRFFGSTETIVSPRAGGAMHNEIIRKLVRQFWEMGYFVDVDTGSEAGEKPDMLVFKPAETMQRFRELTKTMRDPIEWEKPVAYEVETMSNSAEQIRRNLEKNLEKGYEVVFVVPDEDSVKKLESMLGKAEYSVIAVI
ncbi:MAG: hypothetical protein JRN10_04320 [Nitrososphaerota archaeon]|nr:hypothetical protein [Nitrososphaerota archaeon]